MPTQTALPTPPLYAALPTLTVDGREEAALADRVLSLTVDEDTAGLRRSEIRLGNWGSVDGGLGLALSDRATLDFGRALSVRMGAGDRAGTIFDGAITGIEERYPVGAPPELVVLAEDRLQDLRMTRRTRTFTDLSDAALFEQVAGEHGLQAEVDVDGPTHAVLAQLNQSDLAFLRDRARSIDAQLWLEGTTLHVQARSRREGARVTLTHGVDLHAVTVLADLAHQRTALTVTGWDVDAKDVASFQADAATIAAELGDGRSGSDVLREAVGARPEQIVHRVPATNDEARALAEAAFREMARCFLTGSGRAEGDSRITVGAVVDLRGLSAAVSGEYHVTEVSHRFDHAGGFRTAFRVERPWIGAAS